MLAVSLLLPGLETHCDAYANRAYIITQIQTILDIQSMFENTIREPQTFRQNVCIVLNGVSFHYLHIAVMNRHFCEHENDTALKTYSNLKGIISDTLQPD